MRLGIVTRYYHHEATYAALRFAEWATLHGCEVSIFCDAGRARVSQAWDSRVVRDGPQHFTTWAGAQDTLLWTHAPVPEQVSWATRAGLRTIIFAMWHELRSDDRRVFRLADVVITPAQVISSLLRSRWDLRTCFAAPWDVGLPFTVQNMRTSREPLRLFLPWYDQAPQETAAPELLDTVCRVLLSRKNVTCTLAYSPSRVLPSAVRRLRAIANRTGRLVLLKRVTVVDRPMLYAKHDLTIWPAIAENTGHIGLTSLAMGTPVIAFTGPLVCEFLHTRNSVLVPCQMQTNDLGVTSAVHCYSKFEEYLLETIDHGQYVRKLQQTVLFNLVNRRSLFELACQRALLRG